MISYQALALWINIGLAIAVGVTANRRRGTAGAVALMLLCLVVILWTASYIVYATPALGSFRAHAVAAAYCAALLSASIILWLTLVRTNRRGWINARSATLFAAMPLLTIAVFGAIAGREPLFQLATPANLGHLFSTSTLERIVALYVFVIVLGSALLLLDALLERRHVLLSSIGIAFVGTTLPLIVQVVELAGRSALPGLELMPFAFGLTSVGFLNGLFVRRPEEIGAIDRHAAVEGMDEGWIVVDVNDTVVDMNPAAERMTGYERDQVYGQPISSLLGDLSNMGLTLNTSQEVEMKRSIRLDEGWRYLNIRISTLMDPSRIPFGRLTLWRDMTDRKLTEDSRQRARDEMFVLLNAISSAASNTLSTEEFLLESIYHIIYPFRSQVVGIFLMDEKPQRRQNPRLRLSSHLGMPAEALEELAHLPSSSPLVQWAMTHREAMQIADAEEDERVPGPIRRLPVASLLTLPLVAQGEDEDGQFLGCMLMALNENIPFTQDEIVRLTTISDHMANLIDSDRRRKLAIAMNERQRLMRDLHDSVSQKLYGLVTTTEAAQAAMEAGSDVDPGQEFAKIGENARQAVKEMRLFLFQMQQVDVEREGLISVLHHRLLAVEGRANIKARLLAEGEDVPLSTDKQMTLYYVAQEALNNAMRHSRATSVLVTLRSGPKNVILEIEDDGIGFDSKKVDQAGLGLRNMKERVFQLNGKMQILTSPGGGTKVVVAVPRDPA
jgi:PAS domain S-box-containing protein